MSEPVARPPRNLPRVSVIGAGQCDPATYAAAYALGQGLAGLGVAVVTGGLGGVMEAASAGAQSRGGLTIGMLPGTRREDANAYVEVPVVTGLSHMRNVLVVLNGDVVVAVEGGWGTLSEFAFARKMGKVVVAMGKWSTLPDAIPAQDAASAVARVRETLGSMLPDWAPPHAW
ncbi:MAG: TIGR00725 family protein [Desulfovibrio sp.]|nr:TIGR00725 family protein [Desulfovibrio sp.]